MRTKVVEWWKWSLFLTLVKKHNYLKIRIKMHELLKYCENIENNGKHSEIVKQFCQKY